VGLQIRLTAGVLPSRRPAPAAWIQRLSRTRPRAPALPSRISA